MMTEKLKIDKNVGCLLDPNMYYRISHKHAVHDRKMMVLDRHLWNTTETSGAWLKQVVHDMVSEPVQAERGSGNSCYRRAKF